jgi:hypothetical protein
MEQFAVADRRGPAASDQSFHPPSSIALSTSVAHPVRCDATLLRISRVLVIAHSAALVRNFSRCIFMSRIAAF